MINGEIISREEVMTSLMNGIPVLAIRIMKDNTFGETINLEDTRLTFIRRIVSENDDRYKSRIFLRINGLREEKEDEK